MTSANCVQPFLSIPIPSIGSAWNAVQSLTRGYNKSDSIASKASVGPKTLDTSTIPAPPDWLSSACRTLGLHNLPQEYARQELNRLAVVGNPLDSPELSGLIEAEKIDMKDLESIVLEGLQSGARVGATFPNFQLRRRSGLLARHQSLVGLLTSEIHRGAGLGGLQQSRGFKTKRSGSISGLGQRKTPSSSMLDDTIPGYKFIRNTMLDKSQGSMTAEGAGSSERFRTLLADMETSSGATTVQEKMKIAFAEGYVAGGERKEGSGGTSGVTTWSKRIVRFFWYGLAFWLVIQLIQTYSVLGGNMKINVLKGEKFEVNPEEIAVTFNDVKGVDEAKQELSDIVDYLRNPEKFQALGAKLPKGVLLVGPPGIGKSLLARAVAGEAGVPFFHASGSEFDEVFVGTGAKRVRQLFDAAKIRAPCIVFIDEIDTVGAKRTSSQIHPYANQTINQLLSEMDGFQQNEGIIVLGATNRRDNLDKALLRPGRFDVEVRVFAPDLKGRIDILDHYLGKVKIDSSIDVDKLARGTTGCTGADLENLVNQAALKAAMDGDEAVTMTHMEYARDKILMGPAKKSKIPDEETNLITAYHEAGHTLVAYFTRDATPLNKVTIIPRGMSLGHTSFVPDKEQYNSTRSQLLASMDVAMGGRVAEELIYGNEKVTTGASSDFQQATAIATSMVKRWGMSDKVGMRVFSDEEVDTGMSFLKLNEVGPATTDLVDAEIKRLLNESYERARAILKAHQAEHKSLAQALITHETLSSEDIKNIVEGKPINV